jgi:hypothetical protein
MMPRSLAEWRFEGQNQEQSSPFLEAPAQGSAKAVSVTPITFSFDIA